MTLTQAAFEAKYAAKREMLVSAYSSELEAAALSLGYRDACDLMDACAMNEPEVEFADGYCSDEALEFFADSVVGTISK